jgi:hypothetical protein
MARAGAALWPLALLLLWCSCPAAAGLLPPPPHQQRPPPRANTSSFWARLPSQRPGVGAAAGAAAFWDRFRAGPPPQLPPPLPPLAPALAPGFPERVRPLLPPSGCWVGSAMDFATWRFNLSAYTDALGFVPASWVLFVELPLTLQEASKLEAVLPQIARLNGIAILTAEPMNGLGPAALSDAQVVELAALIRRYEALGLRVVVRYAHEANGSWYPW